ncbi:MAG: cytochrome C oxidase subunit IV family protein [Giesbergeria sp.]|nr:cytochrome C oxidase subunit IV family protein [Giesbergeria sp.]
MHESRLNRAWLLLLVITGVTFWMGESGSSASSLAVALVVLGLAFVKGMLVALEFLELREAPALWRWLIAGWLVLVLGLIVLAYALGLPKA